MTSKPNIVERLRADAKSYRGLLHTRHAADCDLAADTINELVEALEAIVERQTAPIAGTYGRAVDGETVRIARDALSKVRTS